jgi:uncharacterized protein YkwD
MAVTAVVAGLLATAASASAQTQTFTGGAPLSFGEMQAAPYPSTLDVAGMGGTISDVNVTLSGVSLTALDLDVLLVAPNGLATLLTSDVPTTSLTTQNWTFDDEASGGQESDLSGTFAPLLSNLNPLFDLDQLPAPAPAEIDGQLLNFDGSSPNGIWKLYAADSGAVVPIGSIAGWSLQLTTVTGLADAAPATGDFGGVTVGQASAPQSFTITNAGDAAMTFLSHEFLGDVSSFSLGSDSCFGQSLLPAATCTVQVAFSPVSSGVKTASLFLGDNTGGAGRLISLTGTGLDPLLSTQGGPGGGAGGGGPQTSQQQQTVPPGSTETGSQQVDVQSTRFEGPTTVGQPTTLHVEAADDKQPVTGLLVNFGETLGLYGASACVEGVKKGGSTTFDVPYRFTQPGPHTITITIFVGGCGKAAAHTITFSQVVDGAKAARRAMAHAADTIAGPDITSKCKNKTMLPSKSKAKTKWLLKALLCVMNEQRKLAGLKPLRISKKLNKAALFHTRAMVTGRFFAHQGPREAGLAARLKKAKYRGAAGENIGAGGGPLGSPMQMVNGWMHSTLHRANLLSRSWRTVGIGFLAQFPVPTSSQPVATYTTDFGVR